MPKLTFAAVFAGLLLVASPALAAEFTPQANGTIDFDMPSGNICCSLVPDNPSGPQLSCTRVAPKYWIVIMNQDGAIDLYKNPGEVPGCGYGQALGNIFEYGETWESQGFSCTSSTSGVRCNANGKGFRLSRKGISYYD